MSPRREQLHQTTNNTTYPCTARPIDNRMPMRQGPEAGHGVSVDIPKHENVVLRREIGEVPCGVRQHQGHMLHEVSSQACVPLGHLSEVKRGQKKAPPELLTSIHQVLGVLLSMMLREAPNRIALTKGVMAPDMAPNELVRQQGVTLW